MHDMKKTHIYSTLLVLAISLSAVSFAYSGWRDEVTITGTAKTGYWKACIRIRKTLDGAYYLNPDTGTLEGPTPNIHIAANHPTYFYLTICVKNRRSTTLTNVVVTDTIKNTIAPVSWTPEKGVTWDPPEASLTKFHFNDLTWNIGELEPQETACLKILLQTLPNPTGKYEPTSGDEGDWQDIEINEGATVTAISPFKGLTATTGSITLIIVDNGIEEDGIGVIESPELPYSTPWAEDRYP